MAKKKKKSPEFDSIKLFDPEAEKINFASICKFIRETFKVTQLEMAQKLKTTVTGYSYWEYGYRDPSGWQAFNLRQLYDQAKEVALKQKLSQDQPSEEPSKDPQQHAA